MPVPFEWLIPAAIPKVESRYFSHVAHLALIFIRILIRPSKILASGDYEKKPVNSGITSFRTKSLISLNRESEEGEFAHIFAKKYFDEAVGLRSHHDQRRGGWERHFTVILEFAMISFPSVEREMHIEDAAVHRNGFVFVHCPEFVQLPEGIVAKAVPLCSRRLRSQDEGICHCGWEQTLMKEVVVVAFAGDRKRIFLSSLRLTDSPGVPVGQSPCKLIQGRPQAADEVPDEHWNDFGHRVDFGPNDMDAIFKICLLGDGIGFRANPIGQYGLKRIEVMLRPVGLHFDMTQAS